MTASTPTTAALDSSGYADVNGLHLYYETHGTEHVGPPLVLLHGGMLTVDLNFAGLIPTLARSRRVIGVELQGHGRTADTDRPISPATFASDVVALLDHLDVERADLLGHSMGAAVALELAVSHPGRIRAVVAASASVRPDGMHEDLMDPSRHATSTRMPTSADFADMSEAYARLSRTPSASRSSSASSPPRTPTSSGGATSSSPASRHAYCWCRATTTSRPSSTPP
jgi:pimeloyl-ACP methyl ester carboxylesterase